MRRSPLAASLLTLAILLAAPAAAHAAACAQNLTDSSGTTWAVDTSGAAVVAHSGTAGLLNGGFTFAAYSNVGLNNCTLEAGGRQVSFPELDVGTDPSFGLRGWRKFYVPASGPGFLRTVTFVRNTSSVTLAFPLFPYMGHAASRVRGTASGDTTLTDADAWAVLANQPAPLAPMVNPADRVYGHIWDAASDLPVAQRMEAMLAAPGLGAPPFTDPGNMPSPHYGLRVLPGQTVALMTVDVGRESSAAGLATALADTPALAAAPAEVYAGLTPAETAQLRNWPDPDPDADGARLKADNCPATANAGQEDLDRDGTGDACDPDADGDGLADATEAAIGANPRQADTDGDGRADGADACPKLAARTADGCPPAGSDATPTKVTGWSLSGVPTRVSRKTFLKGLRVRTGCTEACSILVELRAGSQGGVRAAGRPTNRLLLGIAVAPRKAGIRTITVKPSAALVGRARRFAVQVRVVLTDAGGNQKVRKKTIRVG